MRKGIAIVLIVVLSLSLVACGESGEKPTIDQGDNQEPPDTNPLSKEEKRTIQDEDGLTQVHIENGEAEVYFNLDLWEEKTQLSQAVDLDEVYEGPYKVSFLSGKAKDVGIIRADHLDFLNGIRITMPSFFFLMEDGSVEWVYGDFVSGGHELKDLISLGKLNWIGNIESLSLENTGEGMGEMSLYGLDSQGEKYDLPLAAHFMELHHGSWFWQVAGAYEDGYGVLSFFEDGSVKYEIGEMDKSDYSLYKGSFRLSLGQGDEKPGLLHLDMVLDSSNSKKDIRKKMQGSFFTDLSSFMNLVLWPAEGDPLYNIDRDWYPGEYEFWLGYNPFGVDFDKDNKNFETEDDYLYYLIEWVEEARVMVEKYGMSILLTNEYTDFEYETGRNVWLGTNQKGKFTKEILYSISDLGSIYLYDPIGDGWLLKWTNTYD